MLLRLLLLLMLILPRYYDIAADVSLAHAADAMLLYHAIFAALHACHDVRYVYAIFAGHDIAYLYYADTPPAAFSLRRPPTPCRRCRCCCCRLFDVSCRHAMLLRDAPPRGKRGVENAAA